MAWRTTGWREGDRVSQYFSPIGRALTGTVVRRGRALKVEFEDAVGRPREAWPEGWCFGVGAHEKTCRACSNRFRADDAQEVLCGACDRDEVAAMHADPSTNRPAVRWRTEDGRRRRA